VIRDQGGITYLNCGDWVDSCTAIVEHENGAMELVHWGGESGNVVRFPSVEAGSAGNECGQARAGVLDRTVVGKH
jgi:hypothetical protein